MTRALLIAATALLVFPGCRSSCERADRGGWNWYGYGQNLDYRELEIGIGVREYIPVAPGTQVWPSEDGAKHFDIALRGYRFDRRGLTIQLSAWVEETMYATATHSDVEMKCGRNQVLTVSDLRLELDPAILPPPPRQPPPPDTGAPWEDPTADSGREPGYRDTGWWNDTGYRWDTGFRFDTGPLVEPVWQADVRIEAVVTEPNGMSTPAETLWWVYR